MKPFIELDLPPGVYANGTRRQTRGRYRDADLIRFYEGERRPVGGWRALSQGTIDGCARAMQNWADVSGQIWSAIGTNTGLWRMTRTGALDDITPVGFAAAGKDAEFGGGYGSGAYGTANYGAPRQDLAIINPAAQWTLDTFGETLIACMSRDQKIYQWQPNTAQATLIANAPSARAAMVTDERFIFALGANGDPRTIAWSDQENPDEWAAGPLNQAGDQRLQTPGRLQCGKRVRGGTLVFTDVDVHFAQYLGPPFVYGFERLASGCGIASRQAAAVVDARCFWLGTDNFWGYNGIVEQLNCDIRDLVFGDINRAQISKTYAVHNSAFGEIWWFYPSANSNECDRYAIYNYRENHWTPGTLSRTAGSNRDVFGRPIMVGIDGVVYEHELLFNHDGRKPFLRTGPLEMGNGEYMIDVTSYIADEEVPGDVEMTFCTRNYPHSEVCEFGPFQAGLPTDVRFQARDIEMVYTGKGNADFRIGSGRLEVTRGDSR